MFKGKRHVIKHWRSNLTKKNYICTNRWQYDCLVILFYKKNSSCIFAPRKGKIPKIMPFQANSVANLLRENPPKFQIDFFSNALGRIFVWAQFWAQETFYFWMAHVTQNAYRPKSWHPLQGAVTCSLSVER